MKKNFLNAFIVLTALAVSYGFRSVPTANKTDFMFELVDPLDAFNPNAYAQIYEAPFLPCEGEGYICTLVLPWQDVYVFGMYAGLPKVDIQTPIGNELSDDLAYAMMEIGTPTFKRGRQIYERE